MPNQEQRAREEMFDILSARISHEARDMAARLQMEPIDVWRVLTSVGLSLIFSACQNGREELLAALLTAEWIDLRDAVLKSSQEYNKLDPTQLETLAKEHGWTGGGVA